MSLPSPEASHNAALGLECSCGAVVCTRGGDGKLLYVIVRNRNGIYGFPKGHQEGTETEEETAMREIREETGLIPQLITGFRVVNRYPLHEKPGVIKQVVYFAAEYSGQTPIYQESELSGVFLMDYQEAWNALQFAASRRILREANTFLRTHL